MAGEILGEIWAVAGAAGPVDVRVFVRGVTNYAYKLTNKPQQIVPAGVAMSALIIQNLDGTIAIEIGNDRGLTFGQGVRIPANSILANGAILVGAISSIVLERFARAGLPAFGTAGRAVKLTDYDRSIWLDDGAEWWSVTSEVFDVKKFGAKGDGVTDDTAAVLAAIAALPAQGGCIYFPRGTYVLKAPIIFGDQTLICGAGVDATTLLHANTGANANFLNLGNRSTLQDVTVDGNQANNAGFTFAEINAEYTDPTIRRVRMQNWKFIAIDAFGIDVLLDDCIIIGLGAASIDGGGTAINSLYGVWFAGASATVKVRIRGCVMKDTGTPAILGGGAMLELVASHIEGCHRQTVPTGGGQVAGGNIVAVGNYIGPGGGPLTSGFELNNQSVIEGNTIDGQGNYGIILQAVSGAGHVIEGNIVKNGGSGGAGGAREGITVAAGISDFQINDNAVYDDQGVPTQQRGINVSAGASDRYTVVGNRARNNVLAQIVDSGTGNEKQVVGNLPLSVEAWIAFVPALAQNGAVAATVDYARYRIIGKIAQVEIHLTATAVGAAGFAVQITGIPAKIAPRQTLNYRPVGSGLSLFGANFYHLSPVTNGATIFQFLTNALNGYFGVTPNQAIAIGDQFGLQLEYEIA